MQLFCKEEKSSCLPSNEQKSLKIWSQDPLRGNLSSLHLSMCLFVSAFRSFLSMSLHYSVTWPFTFRFLYFLQVPKKRASSSAQCEPFWHCMLIPASAICSWSFVVGLGGYVWTAFGIFLRNRSSAIIVELWGLVWRIPGMVVVQAWNSNYWDRISSISKSA